MSKAFTSEETPELENLGREPPRVAPGEVRYVTPEGHAALRAKRDALLEERARAAVAPATERDARVADVERRLALAEGTLAALTVLAPAGAEAGRAVFGAWVTVDDEDGRRVAWRLVGPDEADPRQGLVSVHSPVGRALLGREAGDEVEVVLPGGARVYEVVAVSPTKPDLS